MEVGSVRERIVAALLIYKFGEKNVETEIPITEAEVDVKLFGSPISIKTITGQSFGGVKLVWTVDAQKAREFLQNYQPTSDMIFVQINWNNGGGFYHIPLEVQREVFKKMGRQKYIKLPKEGTNPRGAEMSKEALEELIKHKDTKNIEIDWKKQKIDFDPYKKWVDYWRED